MLKFAIAFNHLGVPAALSRASRSFGAAVGLCAAPYGRPRFAGLRFAHCYHPSRFSPAELGAVLADATPRKRAKGPPKAGA